MVVHFLTGLFQQGMFSGGNAEESFFVKCDDETNPPDAVARGELVCQIGVAPVIPAEFIMIDVVQTMAGAG
jgi:phage tail sheath protein FI